MEAKSLSICIVTYNSAPDLLRNCLLSTAWSAAAAGVKTDFVVVDNASSSPPLIPSDLGDAVRVIRLSNNLGFASAVNVAVRSAKGSEILLVNPDAAAKPQAISEFYQAHLANGRHSICGGWLVKNGGVQVDAYFHWWSSLQRSLQRRKWRQQLDVGQSKTVLHVEKVCGGALFGARETLLELGPFDERFFMYGEDADLSLRARQRGFPTILVTNAQFVHEAAASMESFNAIVEQARIDAAFRINAKHLPFFLALALRLELLLVTLVGLATGGGSSVSRRGRLSRLPEVVRWGMRREVPKFTPHRSRSRIRQ